MYCATDRILCTVQLLNDTIVRTGPKNGVIASQISATIKYPDNLLYYLCLEL